jgi:hypothetical protein
MNIYLIEHSVKDFTGFFGGVDFYHGQGSTGSRADAEKLKKLGCHVSEPGTKEIEQDKGEADASPASLSQEQVADMDGLAQPIYDFKIPEEVGKRIQEKVKAFDEKKKPGRKPKVSK